MSEAKHACPKSVGDVDLNTKNRDLTTKKHGYGPLNVDEPGDFWIRLLNNGIHLLRQLRCLYVQTVSHLIFHLE